MTQATARTALHGGVIGGRSQGVMGTHELRQQQQWSWSPWRRQSADEVKLYQGSRRIDDQLRCRWGSRGHRVSWSDQGRRQSIAEQAYHENSFWNVWCCRLTHLVRHDNRLRLQGDDRLNCFFSQWLFHRGGLRQMLRAAGW